MEINATTLQNLDPSKSYYLSNSGEIKCTGFVQWFKCVFNVGDGRAKAAALAVRVKEALLADGAVESDDALDHEIRGLDTSYSLSGADLMGIASRFRASHSEAVGRADARRAAEAIAKDQVAEWVKRTTAHPDPVSVGYMKRLAVYAAAPVIAKASTYADDAAFKRAVRSKMNLLDTLLGEVALFARHGKLRYPADQTLTLPDGKKFDSWGPRLKLDEVHFRLILACMADKDGDIRLQDCCTALHNYPECDVKELEKKIKAIPLADAARPGAVASFANAFKAVYNAHVMSVAKTSGNVGKMPSRVNDGLQELLAEMRGIYGEDAVHADSPIFAFVAGGRIVELVKPLADAADAGHRLLRPSEIANALREDCRCGVAASFVREKAKALAVAGNLGNVSTSLGYVLLKQSPEFSAELLACKNLDEANAVFDKYEGVVRTQIKLENDVEAERKRLPDRASAKLAEALGMNVEEVKNVTAFNRLTNKGADIVRDIVAGTYPGCREKGFNVAAAFDAIVDKFVQTRLDLIREVDKSEGISNAVKAKWRIHVLKTDKPEELEVAKFVKVLGVRGDQMRDRLEEILEAGISAEERAKRLCVLTGLLNAEFVNLYGEEEWEDLGGDGHQPAFTMMLYAVADRVPEFADKIAAVRDELIGISAETFENHVKLGLGQTIREILCYAIAPEK